jgi:hypothetical protein
MASTQQNPSWRRHKRPQSYETFSTHSPHLELTYLSMAAQQFSAALDNLFRLDDGIDTIVQTVEEKSVSRSRQK